MTDTPISPLRRRMIEDMTVRKFTARTQGGYIHRPRVGAQDPDRAAIPGTTHATALEIGVGSGEALALGRGITYTSDARGAPRWKTALKVRPGGTGGNGA